jgi:hypothetical protein
MRGTSSLVRQAQDKKKGILVVLLILALGQVAWAGIPVSASNQTVILSPTAVPGLRIDFNYNFQNALPPFQREPVLPGKEVARGLIPTVPPTPMLRNIDNKELLLNTDHSRDFVNGKVTTYRSSYNGHVFFRDLRVSSIQDGLEIPYTLDLFTYEHFCAGWLDVHSGWAGEFAVAGQKWRLTVVDNLNGEIGRDDTLHLECLSLVKPGRSIVIAPVPEALFIDGHAFNLGFTFKPGESGTVLEAMLTETNLPMGRLNLAARGCGYVCLSNKCLTAVLDATAGASSIPAGTYRITGCLLDNTPGLLYQPAFIRCGQSVVIEAGKTASLSIGLPLRNIVQVTRERNLLRLTYQLLGQAGEQYEYYNWKARPRFAVWNGPVRIASGTLPFG